MKKFLLPILAIIILFGIFGIRFWLGGNEDSWNCYNGQWVKHGNPSAPMPTSGCRNEPKELTRTDIINLYAEAAALNRNKSNVNPADFPKEVGIFNGKIVLETFDCAGDLCPQNSSVEIEYKDIKESDCAATGGMVIYGYGWGRQYMGCSVLFQKIGNLSGNSTTGWSLVYEEPGSPALTAKLLFDGQTLCNGGLDCSKFQAGERVVIQGLKNPQNVSLLSIYSVK